MPSRTGAVIFRGKVTLLQTRRAVTDLMRRDAKRYATARPEGRDAPVVAESKTALWYADEDNATERALLRGKVHNLRGRKGAYELREAARELGLSLIVCGAVLEDADFWQGLDVERQDWSAVDFGRVAAVVLPAFVEHKPRRLLEAVARGVPVVASPACGLEALRGVVSIKPDDPGALKRAISDRLR